MSAWGCPLQPLVKGPMQRSRRVLIAVFGVFSSLGCASEPNDLFGATAGGSGPLPANGGVGAGGSSAVGGAVAVMPDPQQPAVTSGGNSAQGGSTAELPPAGAGGVEERPANGGVGAAGAAAGAAGAAAGSTSEGGSSAETGGTSAGGRAGAGAAGGGGAGSGGTLSGLGGSASGGAFSSATCRELRREMEGALREAQACRPDGQGRQCEEFVDDECGCARPVDDARSLLVIAYEVARDALTDLCPVACTPMLCAAQPRSATCHERSDGTNVCSADDWPQSGPSPR